MDRNLFSVEKPTSADIAHIRRTRMCNIQEATEIANRQTLQNSISALVKEGTTEDKINWLLKRFAETNNLNMP